MNMIITLSFLHIIFLAKPQLKGDPTFNMYDDVGLLQWPEIDGIYSYAVIQKCPIQSAECGSLLNFTGNSHSSFSVSNNYLDSNYFINIYQDDDEVRLQRFSVEDKRGKFIYFVIYIYSVR